MSFIYLFFVGVLTGSAMITPGVSGAVVAVILGVYDKMINALTNLFKNFKKNFIFLFVFGTGILVGAVWFSNIIMFLYERHEVVTKFTFIGLILGGVPFLFKEVRMRNKKINYAAMTITVLSSLALWILSNSFFELDLDASTTSGIVSFINLFFAGAIYSVGKIIPGISSSFLLMIIGMYEYVLSVIAHPITVGLTDINKLIPFIIGLIIGIIVLLRLISYLLEKSYGLTYSVIIGFVIGSIPALIPTFSILSDIFIGFMMMFLGFVFSYKLTK